MEFSKFRVNNQISSRSIFSSKKKRFLTKNQKERFIFIFTALIKYIDYFLFYWKLFYISIKKNYLFELISVKSMNDFFLKNNIFLLFRKLKNNRSTIMLFFNIPFLFSFFILELFESIRKKTVYLYRFFLLSSIPLLIFSVNKTLILPENKKNYLSFILSDNKKTIFEEKSSLNGQKLQEDLLHNTISTVLSTKGKDSFLEKKKFFLNENFSKEKKTNEKKAMIFYKWLFSYKNIKKNYSNEIHSFYGSNKNNMNGIWIENSHDHLDCLKMNQISKFRSLDIFRIKKDSFTKQYFVEEINNFLFSLIRSRDLKFLSTCSTEMTLNNPSLFLKNLQNEFLSKNFISFITKKTQYNNEKKRSANISQNKEWIKTLKMWIEFYPFDKNVLSFSKNKQVLKNNIQVFRQFHFNFQFFKNFFEFYVRNLLLNKINLSLLFLNKKESFIFRSYKKALNLQKYKFVLIQNSLNLKAIPFHFQNVPEKTLNEKINFLYHFYFDFPNETKFLTPESLFFIEKTVNLPFNIFEEKKCEKESISGLLKSKNKIHDLFSYFNYFTSNENFFWLPFQENFLKLKENKQDQTRILFNFALNSTSFEKDIILIQKQHESLHKVLNLNNSHLVKNYKNWFFTPQWWLFCKQRFFFEKQLFLENFLNQIHIFVNRFSSNFHIANKKSLRFYQKIDQFSTKLIPLVQESKTLFFQKIYKVPGQKSFWINMNLLSPLHNNSWVFFSWLISSSIIYYHWIPMLTGFVFFYLWMDFEKVRSLSYPSWQTELNMLTHSSFDSPSQRLRLAGYFSKGKIFLISSKLYSFYNKFFFLFNKLNFITTIDFSKRNKNLISNSLITNKTLQSKYYLWNLNQRNTINLLKIDQDLNGFSFFQKWYKKKSRISNFLPKNRSTSLSLNWLTNLFFYNEKIINSIPKTVNSSNRSSRPTSLLEPFSYTQRWLFIGSLESGKSFIIKSLASNTYYPLIHLSIKTIQNATPDNKYNKIQKQKRWVEQLSERSFLLDNIFKLAKIMAPSFFWISDLHDFDIKNKIQEKNVQSFDISLLMANLLKILSTDLIPERQNQIIFIGSTEYPRLLDPKFVSRQRLDLIINFRTPSFDQKKNIFTSFLNNKGFRVKGLGFSYVLDFNTLGYTFRDITSLVNETLLIKITENNKIVDSNTVRLAFYRQTSTQSVKDTIVIQENLQYKIGKAIVQVILYPKSIMLLSKYYDLWKTKFYYLANTYLDISNKKALTTEFSLFTQIVKCLAGSAARDAWIFFQKELPYTNFQESKTLALTSQVKHDFLMASSILQSLLIEFPIQEITSKNSKNKKSKGYISHTFSFPFLRRALSSLEFFDQFPSYINWSIRGKRLSFNWILFFSGIEHSSSNSTQFFYSEKRKNDISLSIIEKNVDINVPYERRETKRQQTKMQKFDSFFNKLVSILYIEKFGFPWESKYVMEYNPFQFSFFFREARPLWNPRTVMPSYSLLFFDRDLLINQNLLTKLYVTYGNKFQLEKLNRKRIKKQSFWSNFSFEKFDSNTVSEDKKDLINSQVYSSATFWTDFNSYENLINLNAQLEQSQIQLPVYLHQSWISADPNQSLKTFNKFSTKDYLSNKYLISKESILFEFLLEIYNYLVKFFIENNNIMIYLKEVLLKNGILHRQDIEHAMIKYSLLKKLE